MTEFGITEVNDYLADAGWSRTERTWHGAAIWSNGADEVLVPPRDGMGDSAARLRELLDALEHVENRSADEIAREIAYPLVDAAIYQAPASSGPEGFVPLPSGLNALQGIQEMLRTAASDVLAAPRFERGTTHAVSELLGGVQLGTVTAQQIAWAFLVPIQVEADATPVGRQVLLHVFQSAIAVRQALTRPDRNPGTAVGPEFCTALSTLAGEQLTMPFQLGFRWGRGVPSEVPDQVVEFPPGAGEVIQDISRRLQLATARPVAAKASEEPGPAVITGLVEALHDSETGDDRRRVRVRGRLAIGDRRPVTRPVWIRLPDQETYEIALSAHRTHTRLAINGLWTSREKNVRMIADPDGVRIVDEQDLQ
ncbi:hypothetical protein [Kribbella sindirgiensis]|uniref:Uncharacterized protein n=1 Tax=Kribbella sindirgiensis TaxID=1124744 RepID=A0A4R0JG31_9ACTN|nr:hypothetical protein [Kribbella sindirgiensis]TCC43616.1 hypothetical protein E0H50_03995 [Kribbella sindirgiensis]